MNRYFLTALALKMFSINSVSKALYRKLGNTVGANQRLNLDAAYPDRGKWLYDHMKQYKIDRGKDLRFLEVGTGWMHFFSTYLRLFFNFEGTLFDVWDNRQLNALKSNFSQVANQLSTEKGFSKDELAQAKIITNKIEQINSFDELYMLLNFKYQMSPNGSLDMLPGNHYDLIFSIDVLEHVSAKYLSDSIKQYFRVLKPGGYTMHQIGVDDHLTHYASNESQKNYLRFSDRRWSLLYQNDVQYFNRVSYDQFRECFIKSGFREMQACVTRDENELKNISISEQFRNQSIERLEATRVFLIYQKL